MAFYERTVYMQKFIWQPIAVTFSNNVQWNALSPSDTWKKVHPIALGIYTKTVLFKDYK